MPLTEKEKIEAAKPASAGHNVWLGGSCVICPGVSIGYNTVIGK